MQDEGENPPRKHRGIKGVRMDLNLTSMIDVVFLLLIYFIITSNFVMGEGVITSKFPGPSPRADILEVKTAIRITVSGTGDGLKPYRLDIDKGQIAPANFTELYDVLSKLHTSNGGAFGEDDQIVIQPQRQVRWQYVVQAFNAAMRAKFKNIAFAQELE